MSKLSLGVQRAARAEAQSHAVAVVDNMDQALAAATSLPEFRALEELAEAAKRYATSHEQKVAAQAAKWKIARRGGQVLIAMAERGERRTRQTAALKSSSAPEHDLSDLGLTRQRSMRWQRAARLPDDRFRTFLEDLLRSSPEDDLASLGSTAHLSSETDLWETPQDLFDELDAEFHFALDVCASPANAKCERFFSEKGLEEEWDGVCWMNPPYSEVAAWMEKALQVGEAGGTVVCLVPSRTDVAWFWDFARYGEVRFLRGRLSFTDDQGKTGPAPFPSCLVVFGRQPSVVWYERA